MSTKEIKNLVKSTTELNGETQPADEQIESGVERFREVIAKMRETCSSLACDMNVADKQPKSKPSR